MLIKLIEEPSGKECIVNTEQVTVMRSGQAHTTTIILANGQYLHIASPISEIVTIIEKGGNIYDEKTEA